MILKSEKEGNMIPLLMSVATIANLVVGDVVVKKIEKKGIEKSKEDIKIYDKCIKNNEESIQQITQIIDNMNKEKRGLVEKRKKESDTNKCCNETDSALCSLAETIKNMEEMKREYEERKKKDEISKKRTEMEVSKYYARQKKKTT